ADLIDRDRIRDQRGPGLIVDLVIEHRGKAYRAQHSQPIFRETLRWITDCAYQFRLDVRAAANKINHLLCNRIIKHSVNREIAAFSVLFWRGKMHGAGMSAIHVSIVGTKRRHLELETVFDHEDHPKMRANRVGARKKLL